MNARPETQLFNLLNKMAEPFKSISPTRYYTVGLGDWDAATDEQRELPYLYIHALDGSCIDSGRHGGEWVGVSIAREFRCHPDDVVSVEDMDAEDGREWHSINGQRVAYSVWN